MEDCYEVEDGGRCAGSGLVQRLEAQLAESRGRECTALCRDVERDRDELERQRDKYKELHGQLVVDRRRLIGELRARVHADEQLVTAARAVRALWLSMGVDPLSPQMRALIAAVDALPPDTEGAEEPRKQCTDALEVDGGGSFVRCVRGEHPVGEEHFSRGREFVWRAGTQLGVAEVITSPSTSDVSPSVASEPNRLESHESQ